MYAVIIPAAGQGKRMGADKNKILIELDGLPIIERTIQCFHNDEHCRGIYIAAQADEVELMTVLASKYNKVKRVVEGGSERQYSIHNALRYIEDEAIVMVHDAARPFVSYETIEKLYVAASNYGAAIAAVPTKDTIKEVHKNIVTSTPNRKLMYLVQTPQAFNTTLLKDAYEMAIRDDFLGTDDASLVERKGVDVHVVMSTYDNIKITTPDDLMYAQMILRKRE